MTPAMNNKTLERRKMLSGGIKLLIGIGVLFLLVPFFRSITWSESPVPENNTLVNNHDLVAGVAQAVTLQDGSTVFITRLNDVVRARLQAVPEDRFWYPTAPGLLSGDYVAVQATTSLDEPITWLPPQGNWHGGFSAPNGAIWDIAGRALKPSSNHPGKSSMKFSNLMPAPWQARNDAVMLMPLPRPSSIIESSE